MITIMIIGVILTGLWVAHEYAAPGAIGMSGIGVAGLALLHGRETSWEWFAFVATVILFVIGMLVNDNIDDLFHWLALLVSALPWVGRLWNWIVSWPIWYDMSRVPTILVIIGVLAIGYGLYRLVARMFD